MLDILLALPLHCVVASRCLTAKMLAPSWWWSKGQGQRQVDYSEREKLKEHR